MQHFGALLAATALGVVGVPMVATAQPTPEPDPRVVNGTPVDPAAFSSTWGFTLKVEVPGGFCGGTLLTDEVVVTAGHCVAGTPLYNLTVRGGSHDRNTPTFFAAVTDVELAPGFIASDPPVHDLALLRLEHPVVSPTVTMANAGEVPQAGAGAVAGWGCTIPSGPSCLPSTTLVEAQVPIQTASYCNDGDSTHPGYGPGLVDPMRQVCAGAYDDTADAPDTCKGDSGGPLIVRDGGVTKLVGVTSYGRSACGTAPAVYASIGGYRDFIDPVLEQWDPVPVADGTFVPVVPYRLLDSRTTAALAPGEIRPLPLAGAADGRVPRGARAVAINVTAVDPRADGYLTVFPCDQAAPLASNVNYTADTDVAGSAVVGLDATGAACVTSFASADVVVDVTGYWLAPGAPTAGARYHTVLPQRLYDSRSYKDPLGAGETGVLRLDSLADEPVGAVTLNVTAVDPKAAGYLTVFPCDAAPPLASSVNFGAAQTVANAVTVAVSADERLCVSAYAETDLVIDVTGWFGRAAMTSGNRMAPVPPTRLLDTRLNAPIAARGTVAVPAAGRGGVPADAAGVIVNVTAVDADDDGYLVVYPCGQPVPGTSTVNVKAGQDVPNLAFVPVGAGGAICVFSFGTSHAALDLTGYVMA